MDETSQMYRIGKSRALKSQPSWQHPAMPKEVDHMLCQRTTTRGTSRLIHGPRTCSVVFSYLVQFPLSRSLLDLVRNRKETESNADAYRGIRVWPVVSGCSCSLPLPQPLCLRGPILLFLASVSCDWLHSPATFRLCLH
jgi:hypothetical protein